MKKWIVLALSVVLTSASAILVKGADVDGRAAALYRVAFALIAIAPIFLARRRRADRPRDVLACLVGGVFFGIDLAFWNVSVMISSATVTTLLVNLSSVWVGIGAYLFFKEKSNAIHWIANAIALAGVAIVLGPESLIRLRLELGSLFALIASLFLGLYMLMAKKARIGMDAVSVLFYASIGSVAVLLPVCLIGRVPIGGFPLSSWLYLGCIGLLVQVGGYLAINYSLGQLPSAKVSLALLAQPVLTAIIASSLLGEAIGSREALGGAVVLSGLGMSFALEKRGPG